MALKSRIAWVAVGQSWLEAVWLSPLQLWRMVGGGTTWPPYDFDCLYC